MKCLAAAAARARRVSAPLALALLLVACPTPGGASAVAARGGSDRAIGQVVKLLESMLSTSKADGEQDRELYAKFKCYCDDNKVAKTGEVEAFATEIGLLQSKIQLLQADSSKLSRESAKLKAEMDANEEAQKAATAMREKEKEAFDKLEVDLTDAIGQMKQAIDVLSAIGADQSMGAAADHEQYMGGFNASSLLKLQATVKQALVAASATVSKKELGALDAFVQAPFTGAYAAQSASVVGILKNMRETFETNLEAAKTTETAAVEAHGKYMATMGEALSQMQQSYDLQQTTLGSNDDDLATKKEQLATAISGKEAAEQFLEELATMCSEKAKEYDRRVLLRTNEDAAISEAISILNNDVAFKHFGKVAATSTGATSFLQSRSIRRHRQRATELRQEAGRRAQGLLRKAAASSGSALLPKILALLQAGNPFTIVLAEIEKMVALIAKEGEADDKQLAWCTGERESNNKMLAVKKEQIIALEGEIETLTQKIEDPVTGLLATIKTTEDDLVSNSESQAAETTQRRDDNKLYQESMGHLVEAEALLSKAIAVLQKYYDQVASEAAAGADAALVQAGPEPPPTWEGDYKGQSETGGNKVIGMLEFIIKNTRQEESDAHDSELSAQHAYEDSMAGLKEAAATLEKNLKEMQLSLAEAKKSLVAKHEVLDTTNDDKRAIERYLEEIKPGCDFITNNYDLRTSNRKQETQALTKASALLKETPAFQAAAASAQTEAMGDCAGVCVGDEASAQCKACLVHVSVPGYCAGHPGTPGC